MVTSSRKCSKAAPAKQRGLSLIELMIAITLGLILLTGVMQMFLSSRQVFSSQQAISRIQETGRLAMEFMSRDIRMAGFVGCASRDPKAVTDVAVGGTGFHKDYAIGFQALDEVPAGVNLSSEPVGDILVIRNAIGPALPLSANNLTTTIKVRSSTLENDCSGAVCRNRPAVVSDCNKSRIFTPTDLSLDAGVLTLTHAAWSDGADTNLKTFGTDAEVMGIRTIVYYVANNSLWQWDSSISQAHELLEGVENIAVTYGVDTNNDNIPNDYVNLSEIDDSADGWQKVKSVRIELLVRSIEDNVLPEMQPYTFNGTVFNAHTDRYMRQVFINTIGIRSRLP